MAYFILGHRPGQINQTDRNLGPIRLFSPVRSNIVENSFTKKYKIPPGDGTYFFQTDL